MATFGGGELPCFRPAASIRLWLRANESTPRYQRGAKRGGLMPAILFGNFLGNLIPCTCDMFQQHPMGLCHRLLCQGPAGSRFNAALVRDQFRPVIQTEVPLFLGLCLSLLLLLLLWDLARK